MPGPLVLAVPYRLDLGILDKGTLLCAITLTEVGPNTAIRYDTKPLHNGAQRDLIRYSATTPRMGVSLINMGPLYRPSGPFSVNDVGTTPIQHEFCVAAPCLDAQLR